MFVLHTSSLFDCFALLALSVECPPDSLIADSSFGLGMLDGLSLNWLLKLLWARLGVPLIVPVDDITQMPS